LAFQSFDFVSVPDEGYSIFQKCVVSTKFDIYCTFLLTFDIYEKNYISQQIYSPHCCSSDPSAQSLAKLHTRNLGTHF